MVVVPGESGRFSGVHPGRNDLRGCRRIAALRVLYGGENWYDIRGLRERTHYLATRHAGFESAEQYFEGYSIAGGRLASLKVPSTILTAADDPVVPVSDFEALPDNPCLEMIVAQYGGHCGFLKNWKLESMAEDLVAERFLDASKKCG